MVTHSKEFQEGERKFNMGEKSLNGYEIKKLWRNEDGRHFTDVSVASGAGTIHDSRGFAACDFDSDGDMDFFIRNYKQPAAFLRNEGTRNRWLTVRPRGTKSNRDAVGARIEIEAGGKKQFRFITAGCAYLSQHPNEAYFGLGATEKVDRVRIVWPSGLVENLGGCETNARFLAVEGRGRLEPLPLLKQPVVPGVDDSGPGSIAADLLKADIRTLDGAKADLAAGGPVVLVNFWATWCNICRSEFGDLNELARSHKKAGARVVGVAVTDKEGPDLRQTLDAVKPNFEVFTISREEYDRLFGKDAAVPRGVLLTGGRVSAVFGGKHRPYFVRSFLLEALRGR